MRHILMVTVIATHALLAGSSWAVTPTTKTKTAAVKPLCDGCGVVQTVTSEQRDGQGNALGMVGGAVVGGLLGNQVGNGTGNTVATIGGAVGGAYLGKQVQKKLTKKTVWVTTVKMKDGSVQTFEQDSAPAWVSGKVVKVQDGKPALQP